MAEWRRPLAMALAAGLIVLAYADHFQNGFHFDDSHAVHDNPWIRDVRNIPRFFRDGRTFSTLPPNQSYRPVVTASLAIDYWLGGSLDPFWFQVSTFFWFLVQSALMFLLFRDTLERARPSPDNYWIALFATTLYGVHPVMADTVNYVIQRADLYAALAVVAGLVMYIRLPQWRSTGLYLVPVILGILSKPPAAVFPALLLLWIWLFDDAPFRPALRRALPAFFVSAAVAWFTVRMTPPSFQTGGTSRYGYLITQPAVLLGYFGKFFFPAGLSADSDRPLLSGILSLEGLLGFAFLLLLIAAMSLLSRRREMRAIAFGLAWFLIASAPTSLIPLAEVENGHRMYFPFIGLALAVSSAADLLRTRWRIPAFAAALVSLAVLPVLAQATWRRNQVWRTEETLWRDTTAASPRSGRAWVSYGITLMAKKDYAGALTMFERARPLMPNYYTLEINLGDVWAALDNPVEAVRHYVRAVSLVPYIPQPRYGFALLLVRLNREDEAAEELEYLLRRSPDFLEARHALLQIYARAGDQPRFDALAKQTMAIFPSDRLTPAIIARAPEMRVPPASSVVSAERWTGRAMTYSLVGKNAECIAAAGNAIRLDSSAALAWAWMAGCHRGEANWAAAIHAAEEALRLDPGLELAKGNLALAKNRKKGLLVAAE